MHALVFSLLFVIASGLLLQLARTDRGARPGLATALLVFVLAALVGLALAADGAGPGWTGPVLSGLHDPLVALSRELLPDLTHLLGAQLWVLLGVLSIRLVLMLLQWTVRGLQRLFSRLRRRGIHPAREPARLDDVRWSGLQSAARTVLLLTGFALATLPFWGDGALLPAETVADFVWIGYWLLLIELVGRLETASRSVGHPDLQGDDVNASAEHQLEQLYRRYIGRHGDMLFACRRRAGTQHGELAFRPSAPGTHGRAAALLQARWERRLSPALLQRLVQPAALVDAGQDLLLGESLCSHHFVLIAALAQDCIDRGRSVLLLCPEPSLDEVRASLALHADPNLFRLTQDWCVLGRDDLAAGADPDVLLCSDRELERTLLLGNGRRQRPMARLGLIVCLDVQALNVPLARYLLARVRQLAEPVDAVRLVMQAAHYEGVETLARSLHAPPILHEARISAWLQTSRFILVWDRDHEPLAEQSALYFPKLQERIAPEWLLLMLPWELGFAVTRFDPGNRHDEDAYERFRGYLPRYAHDDKLAAAAAHRPVGHGCVGTGAAVSLLDDPGNLLVALDHDGGSSGLDASLINVLCGNYLLRDYFRAVLAAADPQDLPTSLRPLAAQPLGNPYTLAYALARAFAGSAGLTAAEIRDQFLDPSPAQMMDALGIRASRRGLQRLFDLVFGAGSAQVSVHCDENGRTAYCLTQDRRGIPEAYLPALNRQGDPLGRVLATDHGITYAAGQTLLFAHKLHRVVSVGADRVEIRHLDAPTHQPRETYVFHRRYRLPTETTDPLVQPGGAHRHQLGGGLAMTLGFALRDVERETLGYLELAETRRPFAGVGAAMSYLASEPPIRQRYRFQCVTGIAIEGVDTPEAGRDQGHGLARLAFTLCALLQDAMVSVFPDQYARIAVVSPQARVIPAPVDHDPSERVESVGRDAPRPAPAADDLTAFLERMYPALAEEAPTDPESDPPAPTDRGARRIDIWIIEDSGFDLGAARALSDRKGLNHLLGLVRNYLHWALEQPGAERYQGFGAGLPGSAFDYPAARALIERLLPITPLPPTGALDQGCAEKGETSAATVPECDFCATPLAASFERLDDGRCRCPVCAETAVNTKAEFRAVFREVVEQMERDYGIALRRDLTVRFVNAERIAETMGKAFVPTTAMDPRTVGLAIRKSNGDAELLLENGAPRLGTVATLAHELTHIWQFDTVPELGRIPLETIEGQARFVEVDFLRRHGGKTLAESIARDSRYGQDVYSRGYRLIEAACGNRGDRMFACFEQQLRAGV